MNQQQLTQEGPGGTRAGSEQPGSLPGSLGVLPAGHRGILPSPLPGEATPGLLCPLWALQPTRSYWGEPREGATNTVKNRGFPLL